MADLAHRNEGREYPASRTAWGAIWIGVFTFVAIGCLASWGRLFASSANPNATAPVSGISVGTGFWATILTIIAMYVAGRVTAHLTGRVDRSARVMHGMAMFGLRDFCRVVTLILSGSALSAATGIAGGPHSSYMLTVFADIGWLGFVSLFFGWLAALGGASHEPTSQAETRTTS